MIFLAEGVKVEREAEVETRRIRRRLSPEDRRQQLITIGLEELAQRPTQALSVDQVAERAGISRGLLFRYFATKQDFYVAVARAMVSIIEAETAIDQSLDQSSQLREMVRSYLHFVQRHPHWAASLMSGSFGASAEVGEVMLELQATMIERTRSILELEQTGQTRLRLAGWWSMTQTMGLQLTAAEEDAVEEQVGYCLAVLPSLLEPEAMVAPLA